jgi:phosphohistidine phosphatase
MARRFLFCCIMKYLTVVRHAKSSWNQPGLADHDRPLNDRGRRAAPAVAQFLRQTYFGGQGGEPLLPAPDRLLSSTALRAQTTAQLMRSVLQLPPESLRLEQALYLAPPQPLLEQVRLLSEEWRHVMFFGHNPGLHEFVELLLKRGEVPSFPTCAVAILALPGPLWATMDWRQAQLVAYLTPKTLERRFPEAYEGISEGGDD